LSFCSFSFAHCIVCPFYGFCIFHPKYIIYDRARLAM
jgi:hypothetical protein